MQVTLGQTITKGVVNFHVHWARDLNSTKDIEVCFHYGGANWYPAYQSPKPEWPLSANASKPLQPFNYLLNFDLSKSLDQQEFHLILEPLYFNSDGFALSLYQYSPWFIRRDPSQGGVLCVSAKNQFPYMEKYDYEWYRDIQFELFMAKDIRTVVDHLHQHSSIIAKPTQLPDSKLFTAPIWSPEKTTQAEIEKLASEIEKNSLLKGELLLGNSWEKMAGDFSFDITQFPDVDQMESSLHEKGFRLGVAHSNEIHNSLKHTEGYFVHDLSGNRTGFVDFSSKEACEW